MRIHSHIYQQKWEAFGELYKSCQTFKSVIRCLGIKHVSHLAQPNAYTVTSALLREETKLPPLWLLFRSSFRRSCSVFRRRPSHVLQKPALFFLLWLLLPPQPSSTVFDYPLLPQNPFLLPSQNWQLQNMAICLINSVSLCNANWDVGWIEEIDWMSGRGSPEPQTILWCRTESTCSHFSVSQEVRKSWIACWLVEASCSQGPPSHGAT